MATGSLAAVTAEGLDLMARPSRAEDRADRPGPGSRPTRSRPTSARRAAGGLDLIGGGLTAHLGPSRGGLNLGPPRA